MKLFIDDVRKCPDGWILCTTAEQAIDLIWTDGDYIDEVSFDHDLGEGKSGYDVACFIESLIFHGRLIKIPRWKIHSANPVGRSNIEKVMRSAERIGMQLLKEKFGGNPWTP